MFGDPYGERKLSRRDGYAQAFDHTGKPIWQAEGGILEVYQKALKYAVANPNNRLVITENICGQSGIPQSLQISK